jgi:hypothetical protein
MKRLLRIGIVSLAAGVVLFAAFHYIRAQGKGYSGLTPPPAPVLPKVLPPDPRRALHVLLASYITQDYPWIELDAGDYYWSFLESAPTFFTCLTPCTLEINQNVSVLGGSASSNELWFAYILDGNFSWWWPVTPVPSDGSAVEGTVGLNVSLTPGKHCIWSLVSTWPNNSWVAYYHNDYRVYVP